MTVDVIVIGAGPAGLLAAGFAAEEGANVLLLEKMEKPGRKLRITGKGRCNITNTKQWHEFVEHLHPSPRFLKPAFVNFSNAQTIEFLEKIGLPLVVERGDRVFPASQQAQDVADALVKWVREKGVEIRCGAEVQRLITSGNHVTGVEVKENTNTRELTAKAVVLATGGLSYPATGSTGDGYRMAKETGHIVTNLRPSLVALDIANYPKKLNGLELRNVSLALVIDGDVCDEEFGEMSFTETGVDGAIVLRLSRRAVDALLQKQQVELQLNLKPSLSAKQLHDRITREIEELGNAPAAALARKLMPAALIETFLSKAGIPNQKNISEFSENDISAMIATLHEWTFYVSGFQGYERAVVTAGGVSLKEVDNKTMCSSKIDNLFFAGELLDLDGDTGGYNLQIAFSTGCLAGKEAARIS